MSEQCYIFRVCLAGGGGVTQYDIFSWMKNSGGSIMLVDGVLVKIEGLILPIYFDTKPAAQIQIKLRNLFIYLFQFQKKKIKML